VCDIVSTADHRHRPIAQLRKDRYEHMNRILLISGLACWQLVAQAQESSRSFRFDQPIVLYDCPILAKDDIRLSVEVGGLLAEVKVTEGQEVAANQELARVRDEEARMQLELQQLVAKDTSEVEAAKARLDEMIAARDSSKRLAKRESESLEKLREAEAKVAIATAEHQKAMNNMKEEKNKELLASEKVNQHILRSTIDGTIVEVISKEGQAVEPRTPIIRIVNRKRVRIKGSVELLDADRVREGMAIDVYADVTQGPVVSLAGHAAPVTSVVALGDGRRCVSADENGMIIEWDIWKKTQLRLFEDHDQKVTCLATDPSNNERLISADSSGNLFTWELASGRVGKKWATKGGGITALAVHPTQTNLCFTAHDGDRAIRVYDLKTGEAKGQLVGHRSFVFSLALSPDGKRLVSADNDTVRIWDLTKNEVVRVDKGRSPDVKRIGLSPDGNKYLFNIAGNLQVRNLVDGQPTGLFTSPRGKFSQVAIFTPDASLVLVGTTDDEVELWQQKSPDDQARLVRRFKGHLRDVNDVDFSPAGDYFVTASQDTTVKIWRIPSPEEIDRERLTGRITFVNPVIEAQKREIHADIENIGNVLTPGRQATLVVYPGKPIQTLARTQADQIPPTASPSNESPPSIATPEPSALPETTSPDPVSQPVEEVPTELPLPEGATPNQPTQP
jgi:WD40 repeat protein/biotin carboxyl carrier protein